MILNPVFIILVILIAIILWFLLAFVFFPLGKLVYRIWKDAMNELSREEKGGNEK